MNAFCAALVSNGAAAPSPPSKRVFLPFERARHWLRDADLLLVRAPGVVAWAGRGVHWHAATVARWGADWFALEASPGGGRAVPLSAMIERNPNRIDVFRPNPDGRWPEYRPDRAVALTRRAVALRYGWESVLLSAAARIPFVRYLFGEKYFDDDASSALIKSLESNDGVSSVDDAIPETPPFVRRFHSFVAPLIERESLDEIVRIWRRIFPQNALQCAETRALADRYAGVDPVPFLNDRFVEPADLARSPFYRYQFTFEPLKNGRSVRPLNVARNPGAT